MFCPNVPSFTQIPYTLILISLSFYLILVYILPRRYLDTMMKIRDSKRTQTREGIVFSMHYVVNLHMVVFIHLTKGRNPSITAINSSIYLESLHLNSTSCWFVFGRLFLVDHTHITIDASLIFFLIQFGCYLELIWGFVLAILITRKIAQIMHD